MEVDFDSLFADGANLLEIYLCPSAEASSTSSNSTDVVVGWPKPFTIRSGNVMKFRDYSFRDLTCSYDKSNDAQKVTRRVVTKDVQVANLYIIVSKEEQVPAYMFPTTTDIDYVAETTRKSMRINNRLYLVSESESGDNINGHYLYLKYNHSQNVDMTKVKEDINCALKVLLQHA